jgi:fructoselysine 3-epimerase
LLDYTDKTNLLLLIEPAHKAESTLILTVADGLRMISEIKSERLGICLDTGHANINGEDLAQVVRTCQGVPFHIHIDDNQGDSDAHVIPGEGSINYKPFVQHSRESTTKALFRRNSGFSTRLSRMRQCRKRILF